MLRCPHDVYDPSGTGISPYCSGCTTPDPLPLGGSLTRVLSSPFPYGDKSCPVCESREGFKYKSQYDWKCNACGADALNN